MWIETGYVGCEGRLLLGVVIGNCAVCRSLVCFNCGNNVDISHMSNSRGPVHPTNSSNIHNKHFDRNELNDVDFRCLHHPVLEACVALELSV